MSTRIEGREFYQVVQLLRDLLEGDDEVNTLIIGARTEADLFKKVAYPLAVINPQPVSLNDPTVIEMSFDIGCFDIRDISNDAVTDRAVSNDNFVDNMNTTLAVLIRFISKLQIQRNDLGVKVIGASSVNPFIFVNSDALDGFSAQITLQLPRKINLC